jgi:hypothetical protein
LGFIPLLLRSLKPYNTVFFDRADVLKRVHRYAGDFSALGKGEMLILAGS